MSLQSDYYYALVQEIRNRVYSSDLLSDDDKKDLKVFGYGHIGDGNLHLNVSLKGEYDNDEKQRKLENVVEPFVFEYIRDRKGSVSAEHGIGQQKADYLEFSKSNEQINLMKQIKASVDPNFILNPYKIFKSLD